MLSGHSLHPRMDSVLLNLLFPNRVDWGSVFRSILIAFKYHLGLSIRSNVPFLCIIL